jgi:hypothetical protein
MRKAECTLFVIGLLLLFPSLCWTESTNHPVSKNDGRPSSLRTARIIQVSAHRPYEEAEKELIRLKSYGLEPFIRLENVKEKGKWYRIYLGCFDNFISANRFADELMEKGVITKYLIKNESGQCRHAEWAFPSSREDDPACAQPAPCSANEPPGANNPADAGLGSSQASLSYNPGADAAFVGKVAQRYGEIRKTVLKSGVSDRPIENGLPKATRHAAHPADDQTPIEAAFPEKTRTSTVDEFVEGFDYLFQAIGSGSHLKSDAAAPDGMEFNTLTGELRLDLYLTYKRLQLYVKPRISGYQTWVEDETYSDEDFFVNEWLAALNPVDSLSVSYGRENLQWGPSYLFSPSNPFLKENGRDQPITEVRGMDFAKGLWTPNTSFGMSLIANTDSGEQYFPLGFERTYAAKLDVVADRAYLSMIGSTTAEEDYQFGGYFGWTLTDALMLHGEWSLFRGLESEYKMSQLYRFFFPDAAPPEDDTEKYTGDIEGIGLFGGSYTLRSGPTITAEYVYNGDGFSDSEADLLLEIVRMNTALEDNLSFGTTGSLSIPKLMLLRENYILGQYNQVQIKNRINVMLRYLYNLDDQSSRLTTILSYDWGAHTRIIFNYKKNFGPEDSEFTLLYDYNVLLGIELTF